MEIVNKKKKIWQKPLFLMFLIFILCTCIDPYYPVLHQTKSLLVVDAMLTNDNSNCYVKLSRSNVTQDNGPEMISGAFINIRDVNGENSFFNETDEGIYKSENLLFKGETGHSYILNITTAEGEEYESEPCTMFPVQNIENLSFYKAQAISQSSNIPEEGIRLFVDTKNSDDTRFIRWVYDEWWKIIVPDPKKYDFIDEFTIPEVSQLKQTCWGNHLSDDIIIKSSYLFHANGLERIPILFVSSSLSSRFLIRYSIEVKQLSLSANEYTYWDKMKQISETGGDIFEKQAYPIMGNIHNKSDPNEMVLGYFQVSAVSKKRIYITTNEINDLDIPFYKYECDRIIIGPDDFVSDIWGGVPATLAKIYSLYAGSTYAFIEPIFTSQGIKLAFAKHVCADCTLSGTLDKPDFWEDY
jgi:Domain of unknown function (DUF4249)